MSATAAVENNLAISDSLLSRLVLQPSAEQRFDVCGPYALANLHVVCGLEPPKVEEIIEVMKSIGIGYEEMAGVNMGGLIALLHVFEFPYMLGVVSVPQTASIRSFVSAALSKGIRLVLTVCFIVELTLEAAIALGDREFAGIKVWATHGVIPLSVDKNEINVIVGWEQLPVTKLTLPEIRWADWFWHLTDMQPVGICRDILVIYSNVQKGRL